MSCLTCAKVTLTKQKGSPELNVSHVGRAGGKRRPTKKKNREKDENDSTNSSLAKQTLMKSYA